MVLFELFLLLDAMMAAFSSLSLVCLVLLAPLSSLLAFAFRNRSLFLAISVFWVLLTQTVTKLVDLWTAFHVFFSFASLAFLDTLLGRSLSRVPVPPLGCVCINWRGHWNTGDRGWQTAIGFPLVVVLLLLLLLFLILAAALFTVAFRFTLAGLLHLSLLYVVTIVLLFRFRWFCCRCR